MTVIELVCVRNVLNMNGVSTCCHLANRLALPVKISVGDIALILHLLDKSCYNQEKNGHCIDAL